VDVLSSRILPRPSDLDRSRRFYRDLLGLAIAGSSFRRMIPGWCSSPARLLEVAGHGPARPVMLWMQVRDVHAEHARLAAAARWRSGRAGWHPHTAGTAGALW